MRKLFRWGPLLCAALLQSGVAAAENPPIPKLGAPVLITGFGQCIDANLAKIFAHRLKIEYEYGLDIKPEDVDWNSCRTLFAVLGCSNSVCCCSLGSDATGAVVTRDGRIGHVVAGMSILDECERCRRIVEEAKKHNVSVVAMHLGGMARRYKNSELFLPFAGDADYVIVRADGNADGYFTALCAPKDVPLYTMQKGTELKQIIQTMIQP